MISCGTVLDSGNSFSFSFSCQNSCQNVCSLNFLELFLEGIFIFLQVDLWFSLCLLWCHSPQSSSYWLYIALQEFHNNPLDREVCTEGGVVGTMSGDDRGEYHGSKIWFLSWYVPPPLSRPLYISKSLATLWASAGTLFLHQPNILGKETSTSRKWPWMAITLPTFQLDDHGRSIQVAESTPEGSFFMHLDNQFISQKSVPDVR